MVVLGVLVNNASVRIPNVFAAPRLDVHVDVSRGITGTTIISIGTVIIEFAHVVTVPPAANVLQVNNTSAPSVIESLKLFHIKVEFAPSDIAHPAVHQT
jgi:hypothetical protein